MMYVDLSADAVRIFHAVFNSIDPTTPFFAPAGHQPHNVQPPLVVTDWGKDAARMAMITLRRPVRVAVHAEMMLP